MAYDGKTITVKEFRELGFIQELNRRFLHPLGLALEVRIDEHGKESIERVWDNRDDPEGMIFGDGMIDPQKAEYIYAEEDKREAQRKLALGYIVQPVPLGSRSA